MKCFGKCTDFTDGILALKIMYSYIQKNTLPENRQILNCPVMGSMQLTQFFTTFWTAKRF